MPPQVSRGDPPACTSFKARTAGRIPLGTSFLATRGGATDAGVPTQPASHASLRLRPKEVRSRSRGWGSVCKLKLCSSPESHLRVESDTVDLVSFFFARSRRGLSSSPTIRSASAATRVADPRRSQFRATASHWSLVCRSHPGKQPHSSAHP